MILLPGDGDDDGDDDDDDADYDDQGDRVLMLILMSTWVVVRLTCVRMYSDEVGSVDNFEIRIQCSILLQWFTARIRTPAR